ncbi:hypothetical protein E2C01_009247 [Portunus trituberculatus]|uniref:Uncharacterized protein n=1 Tax=Portunus trituberculatus TaxID=210409 RepID=A0A5B7D5D3_PORTR|nr:hypothetical protein [Portunus trituberculatus]
MAAKLSAESKEDDAGSASPRHASPFARTISTQKIVSKLPRGSEASPQSPSPSHLTSSSSSCTDRIESDALQTSDKSLQEAASSPRLRQSDIEFAASESLSDSKSCEGGPSEPQSPSQLAKEDWTASASKQSQQGHSSSQEGFPQKEGSMPRSRDTKYAAALCRHLVSMEWPCEVIYSLLERVRTQEVLWYVKHKDYTKKVLK